MFDNRAEEKKENNFYVWQSLKIHTKSQVLGISLLYGIDTRLDSYGM